VVDDCRRALRRSAEATPRTIAVAATAQGHDHGTATATGEQATLPVLVARSRCPVAVVVMVVDDA